VHNHLVSDRLLALTNGTTRLSESELEHLEECNTCQAICAEFMVEAVREKAKGKYRLN